MKGGERVERWRGRGWRDREGEGGEMRGRRGRGRGRRGWRGEESEWREGEIHP